MKTFVVINRHVIAANRKNGTDDPPIRVTRGKHGRPVYARHIRGSSFELLQDTMPCGATIALFSNEPVEIVK